MRPAFLVILCAMAFAGSSAPALAQRAAWETMPPDVSEALHAFRQTDHPDAEGLELNFDGDRQGRYSDGLPPSNFDPSRHLLYLLRDLNGDGLPEVFLLFNSPYMRGTREARGVVMVQQSRGGPWRIGCDIDDWGDEGPRGGIHLLQRRRNGWRDFRTSYSIHTWRRMAGQPAAMECVVIGPGPQRSDAPWPISAPRR